MPAQITLWKTDGTSVEYNPANSDVARGQQLLAATNAATAQGPTTAGDMVVAGPGNYLKAGAITRDGVRIYLYPNARIYSTSTTSGPVINVTSDSHYLYGRGIIEHTGVSAASAVHAVYITGGSLVCEADEIISADQAAVFMAGTTATLYLNIRRILAMQAYGLSIGDGTCFVRVQHLLADGTSIGSNAINVSAGNANSIRNINVQRIESKNGEAILLQGPGRSNVWCQSVHSSNNTAVRSTNDLHYLSLGQATNAGSEPTIKLVKGHLVADQIAYEGTTLIHAVEVSEGSRLTVNRVVNNATSPGANSNGIKVLSSSLGLEPLIDVGEINLPSAATYSIFADSAQNIYMIRDYRSTKGMKTNITVKTPNHP